MTTFAETDDADGFGAVVEDVFTGVACAHEPPEIFLIKIDNWFGPRWLRFSGKTFGALGLWKSTLTVPPFVPNRVVWERRFVGPLYDTPTNAAPGHVSTPSDKALSRRVAQVAPGAAFIWFSGASEANGRGAVMAYIPVPDSYWAWYSGFSADREWQPTECSQITNDELASLREFRGSAARSPTSGCS